MAYLDCLIQLLLTFQLTGSQVATGVMKFFHSLGDYLILFRYVIWSTHVFIFYTLTILTCNTYLLNSLSCKLDISMFTLSGSRHQHNFPGKRGAVAPAALPHPRGGGRRHRGLDT